MARQVCSKAQPCRKWSSSCTIGSKKQGEQTPSSGTIISLGRGGGGGGKKEGKIERIDIPYPLMSNNTKRFGFLVQGVFTGLFFFPTHVLPSDLVQYFK